MKVETLSSMFIAAVSFLLIGCADDGIFESREHAFDRGFDDGYAAGYNTTCEIRATLIAGDWDKDGYSDGYRSGYQEGALACKRGEPP